MGGNQVGAGQLVRKLKKLPTVGVAKIQPVLFPALVLFAPAFQVAPPVAALSLMER